ncbi:hypothetical protein BHM03_00035241 [Ensete ventricosum]|uniref:Uncharacterized protein n=1 Tax=Ensete ventricosum TaxID=4639 RepID=A0A426Z794_ENSVE|nr:hypothetical protein B296_00025896 [Ensete ventricosum]RZS04839.1 hypothetical protein BHM03_00035241 [Ensete ventricosum]
MVWVDRNSDLLSLCFMIHHFLLTPPVDHPSGKDGGGGGGPTSMIVFWSLDLTVAVEHNCDHERWLLCQCSCLRTSCGLQQHEGSALQASLLRLQVLFSFIAALSAMRQSVGSDVSDYVK